MYAAKKRWAPHGQHHAVNLYFAAVLQPETHVGKLLLSKEPSQQLEEGISRGRREVIAAQHAAQLGGESHVVDALGVVGIRIAAGAGVQKKAADVLRADECR
eukprot:scaffold576_cov260-Pinguiococcus_pyrenoidosus.AAC.119